MAGDWCQQGILSHISFDLLQTHPAPEKHLHQHRGPQWGLNRPTELHYPTTTFSHPSLKECQKHPKSLKWHHKQGVAQKTPLGKRKYVCLGNEPPCSVNRVGCCERRANAETSFIHSVIAEEAAKRPPEFRVDVWALIFLYLCHDTQTQPKFCQLIYWEKKGVEDSSTCHWVCHETKHCVDHGIE